MGAFRQIDTNPASASAPGRPQKQAIRRSGRRSGGPWSAAWARLRGDKVAMAGGVLCLLLLLAALLAPVYASDVAHSGPNENHLGDTVAVDGKSVPVVSTGGTKIVDGEPVLETGGVPLGPQGLDAGGRFVLGADANGRDVAVRTLYGLRISLLIGVGSALACTLLACAVALLAAFYRGRMDWFVVQVLDVIWAFPVILLAVGIATALSLSGFHRFGLDIEPGSLVIPVSIISLSFVPYLARPLRGELLSVRERDYVKAAIAQGAGAPRIMFREMLPNALDTLLVLFTLTVANMIIFEAALSFLGAGVQPPNPSLGVLINEGAETIVTAPWLALVPGVTLTLTVLALNLFGEGLRQALDIRTRVISR